MGHGDLLKLAVPNDYSVVVAGGYAGAEFLTVGLLEVFLRRDEDIRGGIEPEELACPLLGEVVWHDEHGLAAQSQPFGLHRRRSHCEGFPSPNFVREQGVAAVEYARNRVTLVLAKLNFRVHSGEGQV